MKKTKKKRARKATQPSAANGRQRAEGPDPAAMYEQTATGFVWHKLGALPVPLSNFTATITEDVELVDEAGRRFTLEVTIAGRPPATVSVSLADFLKMQWPMALLGAGAFIDAGMGLHDRVRAAIQTISTPVRKRVYTRLGWRKIHDAWHYLYAGGAIGPDGPVSDIAVEPPPALKRFILPAPPTGDARVAAVRASLHLLELGPARIMVVLVAILACAILGGTDFSVHLVGRSGVFKTALAVLVQQHWGASMDERHLPTGWGSTDNAIESILARGGDTIVCVDDFNPTGTQSNVQRAHQGMERVVRAQGNQQGRIRMRQDTSLREGDPPRCIPLSTGEDEVKSYSGKARVLIVDVRPGDITKAALDLVQPQARQGLYAAAMAAFVQWCVPRYNTLHTTLRAKVEAVRASLVEEAHKRTTTTVAHLIHGFNTWLEFTVDVGAFTPDEAEAWRTTGRRALLDVGAGQVSHQEAAEPTEKFLELLASAIGSRAHLTSPTGELPSGATKAGGAQTVRRWGWRLGGQYQTDWLAQGECIGWVDGDDLYLDPGRSFSVVQRLAREQDDTFTVAASTLHRLLRDQGLLVSCEGGKQQRIKVRRCRFSKGRDPFRLSFSEAWDPGT